MTLARFRKVYEKLPPKEKELPVLIIKNEKITWDKAYDEIKRNTVLGKKIIKKLVENDII